MKINLNKKLIFAYCIVLAFIIILFVCLKISNLKNIDIQTGNSKAINFWDTEVYDKKGLGWQQYVSPSGKNNFTFEYPAKLMRPMADKFQEYDSVGIYYIFDDPIKLSMAFDAYSEGARGAKSFEEWVNIRKADNLYGPSEQKICNSKQSIDGQKTSYLCDTTSAYLYKFIKDDKIIEITFDSKIDEAIRTRMLNSFHVLSK